MKKQLFIIIALFSFSLNAQNKENGIRKNAEFDFGISYLFESQTNLTDNSRYPLKLTNGSPAFWIKSTGFSFNGEILLPITRFSHLYFLIGITILDGIHGYVNGDVYHHALEYQIQGHLQGGGPYFGLYLEKYLNSKIGFYEKVSVGFFSFHQRIYLDENNSYSSSFSEFSSTISQFGGKLSGGLLFNIYGIKFKPALGALIVGQKSVGYAKFLGFEMTTGF